MSTVSEPCAAHFAEEPRRAWRNVGEALGRAGAKISDVVQARSRLINADDVATYMQVRDELMFHRTTSMLGLVPRVIRSDLRVEIEVVATVTPGSAATGQDA